MSSRKETTINSLPDYVRKISAIKEPPVVAMSKNTLVYRGLSYKGYDLMPSLGRLPEERRMNQYVSKEAILIEQAQLRFPHIFCDDPFPVIKLAKLQHYGIPTRLLDVTTNALVALYFACQNSGMYPEEDGMVIVISDYMYSAYDAWVNAIADTHFLTRNAVSSVRDYCSRLSGSHYFSRVKYEEQNNNVICERFMKYSRKPLLVNAGSLTERQKNQHGKFLIFPNRIIGKKNSAKIDDDIEPLKYSSRCIIKKLTIPHKEKAAILDQLRRSGVTEDFLFADDVDKVNASIKREISELYH